MKCYHDKTFAFLAALAALTASLAKATPGPGTPTFVGGVAVLTGAGAALMSHLLLRFLGSSPVKEKKNFHTMSSISFQQRTRKPL